MAVHHFIWKHLYTRMQTAQTPASKLRFVTPDRESSMSTLWQEEEFEQIYRENRWRKRQQTLKKTISVKEHERERYDFDPTMFYENRFWNRRPDGIVLNKNHWTLYILESSSTGCACRAASANGAVNSWCILCIRVPQDVHVGPPVRMEQ